MLLLYNAKEKSVKTEPKIINIPKKIQKTSKIEKKMYDRGKWRTQHH